MIICHLYFHDLLSEILDLHYKYPKIFFYWPKFNDALMICKLSKKIVYYS